MILTNYQSITSSFQNKTINNSRIAPKTTLFGKDVFLTGTARLGQLKCPIGTQKQCLFESVLQISNDMFKRNLRFLHQGNENVENQSTKASIATRRITNMRKSMSMKKAPVTLTTPFTHLTKQLSEVKKDNPMKIELATVKSKLRLSNLSETCKTQTTIVSQTLKDVVECKNSKNKKKPMNMNYCDFFYLYKLVHSTQIVFSRSDQRIVKLPKHYTEVQRCTVVIAKTERLTEENDLLMIQRRESKRASKLTTVGRRTCHPSMLKQLGIRDSMLQGLKSSFDDRSLQGITEENCDNANKEVVESDANESDDQSDTFIESPPPPYTSKWMKLIDVLLDSRNVGNVNPIGYYPVKRNRNVLIRKMSLNGPDLEEEVQCMCQKYQVDLSL